MFAMVKADIEKLKKMNPFDWDQLRRQLTNLCQQYPTCYLVWVELSRLEMEMGNIRQCRDVIIQGLSFLPGQETLLEKRAKAEERLRNVNGVIDCANQFLNSNNSRCVKSIVDTALATAKLGYGYHASSLFDRLLNHEMFVNGGVTLDYIRFVFKTEGYHKGTELLLHTLHQMANQSPLWFFTFSILEQDHTVHARRDQIEIRPANHLLITHLMNALNNLDNNLKWKVYYIAAQAQLRSFTHIRLWTRLKKRHLYPYCKTYPGVIRQCCNDLQNCVCCCPEDYKWKVWLLAGRVLALAGQRRRALKV